MPHLELPRATPPEEGFGLENPVCFGYLGIQIFSCHRLLGTLGFEMLWKLGRLGFNGEG